MRNSEWARENRQRLTLKAAKWRAANPDLVTQINAKSKHKHKAKLSHQHATWARLNRHLRRAADAKYKAAKRQATPAWADNCAIQRIYQQAVCIQRETGQRMHVDHIVPLQSPIVCGLHCQANLQVMPGSENESKRNFWWPNMPDIEQAQRQSDLFVSQPAPAATQLSMDDRYTAPLPLQDHRSVA